MLKKPTTSIPNPAKASIPSVKIPKITTLGAMKDTPSILGKTEIEEFSHIKHPTLAKLKDFMSKKHRR